LTHIGGYIGKDSSWLKKLKSKYMSEKQGESGDVPSQSYVTKEGAGEVARAAALKMETSDALRIQDQQPQEANKHAASPAYTVSEIKSLSDEIHAATAKLIALLDTQNWDQPIAARAGFDTRQVMVSACYAICTAHNTMITKKPSLRLCA
jgi:hypothetical protein